MNTDEDWENFAKQDPYFSVCTNEKYRSAKINDEAKKAFFESGSVNIRHSFDICRRYIDPSFSPKSALDFGCGIGRLTIPLAALATHVTGVDVSDSMLAEARNNCAKFSVDNVSFIKSDDDLTHLEGHFDFIYSYIVLQHIPIDRGTHIFSKLLDHLNAGGICAIQFTYAKTIYSDSRGAPPAINGLKRMRHKLDQALKRLLRRINGQRSVMQMNSYNLNEIFFLMQASGVTVFHTEFTDHGGECGVFLYFQKPMA